MLARKRQLQRERRGIVLVLILGMLALMAIIGITFATYSNQARLGARSFAASMNRPLSGEFMDYALSQLIGDTGDIRSAIRGHSMARDMYGNDAANNGYLEGRPGGADASDARYNYDTFQVINAAVVPGTNSTVYDFLTNIRLNDPALYGYNFTRWVIRLKDYQVVGTDPKHVDQTFEVLIDDYANQLGSSVRNGTTRVLRVSAVDSTTVLKNPTMAVLTNNANWNSNTFNTAALPIPLTNFRHFILDGRFLRAFNGPGHDHWFPAPSGLQASRLANYRYNGFLLGQGFQAGDPNVVGMDEDYDAVDLENWFLAMQSADGQVAIPSFHRPSVIRYDYSSGASDPTNNDWSLPGADSLSRILRPRGVDHPKFAADFPDPVPNADGKITYDVDNDGDGLTDSVWVDLGYPSRTDERGINFKPLFAFLVVGLNGRIPLNTAGNLAGANNSHAAHLGNSPSEIDPTYALQNSTLPGFGQTDNANVDVRLTQLRNLLAGTRPNPSPYLQNQALLATGFGDLNFVALDNQQYYMPNGLFDARDVVNGPDPNGNNAAYRNTQPVPGRWGDADLVPGYIPQSQTAFSSRVKAGLARGYTYGGAGVPRGANDDNFNVFDPYPSRNAAANPPQIGEVRDQDMYDPSGGLLLPVERERRFITPRDINGTGQIVSFNAGGTPGNEPANRGADALGRVTYKSYFRPPGLPGIINSDSAVTTVGAIGYLPTALALARNPGDPAADRTNNPLHAFDFFRFPASNPSTRGGMPSNLNGGLTIPTYDMNVAGNPRSDGLDEADEMNLYQATGMDAPFGYGDLEWLYRKQDIDGAQLSSRLASLAPISFTDKGSDPGHGLRHRRLFTTEIWESNQAVWTPDNPADLANPNGQFLYNSRFTPLTNADFANLNVTAPMMDATQTPAYGTYPWIQMVGSQAMTNNGPPTNFASAITPDPVRAFPIPSPSIAHRERKINLNFPLPVSNDPNEPIRRKWVKEAYELCKAILPPKSIDTPEELAQLSQFLLNVVDFRDPDATMTHFTNPDVFIDAATANVTPILKFASAGAPGVALQQYGMEFNPIAINETLLYTYVSKQGMADAQNGRFFMELLNTLTAPAKKGTTDTQWPFNTNSSIDLGGTNVPITDIPNNKNPYNIVGTWDLIFTADTPESRPDPYTGQLNPTGTQGHYYGLVPLNKVGFGAPNNTNAANAVVHPLATAGIPTLPTTQTTPIPTNYPYVLGSQLTNTDQNPISQSTNPPSLTQSLDAVFDPVGATMPPTDFRFPGGVVPGVTGAVTTPPTTFAWKLPAPGVSVEGAGPVTFYWVCLRRPANLFAPVSATNPLVVVDSMRVPYIDGTIKINTGENPVTTDATRGNDIYSVRRWQPYRGGHAVPMGTSTTLDPRYGYTEQIVPPVVAGAAGMSGYYDPTADPKVPATKPIDHTLGNYGITGQRENWDHFPFHDRDFTSVAELLLVPGCPPGLFTKQFVENARINNTTQLPKQTPMPTVVTTLPLSVTTGVNKMPTLEANLHTYPYLNDKFYYTAASDNTVVAQTVGGYTGNGWHKMLEFFEVPSQALGSYASVSEGANFDWQRQDTKPGLINLNLVMDEEVFLSILGKQNASFAQQLLNFTAPLSVLPHPVPFAPLAANRTPRVVTGVDINTANGTPVSSYELPLTGFAVGNNTMIKAAFAQFLKLRHGGSGFLFANGLGATGTPTAAMPSVAAERPFRSLSHPDINMTVMRPASLPPSAFSNPVRNLSTAPGTYANDPALKNNNLFPGYQTSQAPYTTPASPVASSVTNPTGMFLPPPVPARRLFQMPDTGTTSNATQGGYSLINVQRASGGGAATGSMGAATSNLPDMVATSAQLGTAGTDAGRHPFFRTELLQRVMNLTTVRTHQYAVWITVGFFRVVRQGDPVNGSGVLAYDQLGEEVGLPGDKKLRYRGFFVVDRLKLTGFDPNSPGNFRDAVLYRKTIE